MRVALRYLILFALALFTVVMIGQCSVQAQNAYVLDGLLMYGEGRPMDATHPIVKEKGYKVIRMAHTNGKRLKYQPKAYLGHSMGGNAALKAAARLKKPVTVITIDPGRAPLYHSCPSNATCINLYNPWHPIGGQYVNGATNIPVYGTLHGAMPYSLTVQALIRLHLPEASNEPVAPASNAVRGPDLPRPAQGGEVRDRGGMQGGW
jgi:hypothetical protein